MAILVSEVNTRVRSLVGDSGGDWTTSAVLLPYINAAYEEVATQLRARGVAIFRKTSPATAIASGTLLLGRTGGATQYPSDLVRPIEVVERVSGTGLYVRMSQSQGVMDDRNGVTTSLMGRWDWKNDNLYFPGASGNVQVKIEYDASLAALTGDGDSVLIQDGLNAVSLLAASYAVRGRGQQGLAADFVKKGQEAIDRLTEAELGLKAAMTGRWGPQDQSTANSAQSALRFASVLMGAQSLPDADLFIFVCAAYRDVARRLRAEGMTLFRRTSSTIVVGAGTTALLRSSGTQYPSDLIRPLEVMEHITGGTGDGAIFRRMTQSKGLFDSRAAAAGYLGYWEWKDDGIRFGPGSTDLVDVIGEYDAALPELTLPTDVLLIPDSCDAIAYLAASYALAGKTQDSAAQDRIEKRAQASVSALVLAELAVRKASSGRWGTQDQATPAVTVARASTQRVIRMAAPLVNTGAEHPLEDAEIFQFVRLAYQDVAKALRASDVNVFVRNATISAIPINTTSIGRNTSPPLPSDFVRPLRVRIQLLSNDTPNPNRWFIVRSSQNAFLSGEADTSTGVWEWRDDQIRIPTGGYGFDMEVQYEAFLPDLETPQDEIKISDGDSAVAFMAAAYAVLSMGRVDVAAGLKGRATELIADLVKNEKAAAAAQPGNAFYQNE